MNAIVTIYLFLARAALFLAGILIMFLTLFGAADVVAEYFFGMSFPFKLELSEVVLAAMVFLVFSAVHIYDEDISIDAFNGYFSVAAQENLKRLGRVFGVIFQFMLAYFLWRLALDSISIREVALGYWGFPVYPFKVVAAIGMSLSAVGLTLKFIDKDVFRARGVV